jgi:hypothetical protein
VQVGTDAADGGEEEGSAAVSMFGTCAADAAWVGSGWPESWASFAFTFGLSAF